MSPTNPNHTELDIRLLERDQPPPLGPCPTRPREATGTLSAYQPSQPETPISTSPLPTLDKRDKEILGEMEAIKSRVLEINSKLQVLQAETRVLMIERDTIDETYTNLSREYFSRHSSEIRAANQIRRATKTAQAMSPEAVAAFVASLLKNSSKQETNPSKAGKKGKKR
jgi:uncharacterized NAD(P)/FAD-binding protein YdhS